VPEGLTLEETADRLVLARLGDRDAFLALMRDPKLIADLDSRAEDLEGYLFPDSYTFAADTAPKTIVEAMVANFRKRWRTEVAPKLPADGGRTLREVTTLASIVEKEAKAASERPLIAAVYANRLERGMGLFADPTVIFALKRLGRWDGNIRKPDLALDSPYNTYKYAGLPPGPICSPGTGALAAAAAPPTSLPLLRQQERRHPCLRHDPRRAQPQRQTWQHRYWRDAAAPPSAAAGSPADHQPPAGAADGMLGPLTHRLTLRIRGVSRSPATRHTAARSTEHEHPGAVR
jgi:hypothetical protein